MGETAEKGVDGVRREIAVSRSLRIAVVADRSSDSDDEGLRAVEGPGEFLVRIKSPCNRRSACARLFLALA